MTISPRSPVTVGPMGAGVRTLLAGVAALLLLAGEAFAFEESVSPRADATLLSGQPTTNFGTSEFLDTYVNNTGGQRLSILKFDLTSLNGGDLTGLEIVDVTLRLYINNSSTSRTYGIYSSTSSQNDTWNDTNVTWNNFNDPAGAISGASLLATAESSGAANEFLSWSSAALTDHVKAHFDNPAPVTLIVRDSPTASLSFAAFLSKETGNASLRPALIVTYTLPLDVGMTATTTAGSQIFWEIDKSVDPTSWVLFRGDSGTSRYTVRLDKLEGRELPRVSGGVSITNPASNGGFPASITGITANICDMPVALSCPGGTTQTLNPGAVLNCTYGPVTETGFGCTYNAAVTTTGSVHGGTGSATPVSAPPVVVGPRTVNVDDDDDRGDRGPISDSTEYSYERTFTCDADDGAQTNTATILETGQSDNASVSIDCRALEVSKDATTAFTRAWSWEIDKTADQDTLELAEGEAFEVAYAVTLNATDEDSDHRVSGNIVITNNAPIAAALGDVVDQVGGTSATVTCPGGGARTLAAGATLTCTYEADVDPSVTQNTATATLNNFAYNAAGQATPAGTTDFAGTAAVSFVDPTTEVDRCVDVADSLDAGGVLPAEACAPDASFDYMRFVGPYAECGDQQTTNTAAFTASDTDAVGEASHTVAVNVTGCDTGGCTLGQGYWKTHSEHGPAPYDANWANLGAGGADTPFFDSGQSYYKVMWTASRGNVYYILAHQYIAATLNKLNGADFNRVQQATYDRATDLFDTYAPKQIARLRGKNGRKLRAAFVAYAVVLGAYNVGKTGPGKCDQDRTVAR